MRDIQIKRKKTNKEYLCKVLREFRDGNIEMLINHSRIIDVAFEAGYLAGKYEKSKGKKH